MVLLLVIGKPGREEQVFRDKCKAEPDKLAETSRENSHIPRGSNIWASRPVGLALLALGSPVGRGMTGV